MEHYELWFSSLTPDELTFIKHFVLASGSLKELAAMYSVSYPTIRGRLNGIIEKIKLNDVNGSDPYIDLIKKMALEGKYDFETAAILVAEYREVKS